MLLRPSGLRLRKPVHSDVAAFAANVVALVLPLMLLQLFDRVIPAGNTATLTVLALIILSATLCEAALRAATSVLAAVSAEWFQVAATDRLVHAALYAPKRLSDPSSATTVAAQFEAVERLRQFHAEDTRQSRFDLPFIAVFFGAFYLIAPTLIWALIAVCGLVLLSRFGQGGLDQLDEDRIDRAGRQADFLHETFAGIESVKAFQAEAQMARRMDAMSLAAARARHTSSLARGKGRAWAEATAAGVPVVIAILGAAQVMQNTMTGGALAAAIMLSGRIVQPLVRARTAEEARRALRPAERALFRALDAPLPVLGTAQPGALRTLEIRDVTVKSATGAPILDRVSLMIEAGETVAITGPSGAGKSVLLAVIAGRIAPDAGTILWNGVPIEDFDPDALGARIGRAMQSWEPLNETIVDTLTAAGHIPGEDVAAVIDELAMRTALFGARAGAETNLADKARSGIPGAARELVPLASILARSPDLLLFDEANRNLDMTSDGLLRAAIERRKRQMTQLLVTQRPSYLALADREYRLDAGGLQAVERAQGQAAPADTPAALPLGELRA